MSTSGFVYIATGERFLVEAKASVASLKQHMPTARTCCFTDDLDKARPYFDDVKLISSPYRNFFEKIPPLSLTPFDRTIFVDTDTIFAADMNDVFELLLRFEIAIASDPFFCGPREIPACFSHLNTGLIAYQNTDRVRAFFQNWFTDYKQEFDAAVDKNACHDQFSFQRALYESDLRLYVLPTEYNFRIVCPQLVRLWAPVKMMHARGRDLAALAKQLNGNGDVKIVWPNWAHFRRTRVHMINRFYDRVLRIGHSILRIAFGLKK
jgi:hypothetical protein